MRETLNTKNVPPQEINNTTTLQCNSLGGGAPPTVYDSSWLAAILTRLVGQSQASAVSNDSVAFVVASPCLRLMDTSNPNILQLYNGYTPIISATDPFGLVWKPSGSQTQRCTLNALPACGFNNLLFTPTALSDFNMVLFKGSTLNYISSSQLVLGEGFFASSRAQLKSIRIDAQ